MNVTALALALALFLLIVGGGLLAFALLAARNDGEMLMLATSELSEALEALRLGNQPDDKMPEFDGYTAEIADCIIRLMDLSAGRGLPVAKAIVAKMVVNERRSYRHGKRF